MWKAIGNSLIAIWLALWGVAKPILKFLLRKLWAALMGRYSKEVALVGWGTISLGMTMLSFAILPREAAMQVAFMTMVVMWLAIVAAIVLFFARITRPAKK